jgi:hypothetical protein
VRQSIIAESSSIFLGVRRFAGGVLVQFSADWQSVLGIPGRETSSFELAFALVSGDYCSGEQMAGPFPMTGRLEVGCRVRIGIRTCPTVSYPDGYICFLLAGSCVFILGHVWDHALKSDVEVGMRSWLVVSTLPCRVCCLDRFTRYARPGPKEHGIVKLVER